MKKRSKQELKKMCRAEFQDTKTADMTAMFIHKFWNAMKNLAKK